MLEVFNRSVPAGVFQPIHSFEPSTAQNVQLRMSRYVGRELTLMRASQKILGGDVGNYDRLRDEVTGLGQARIVSAIEAASFLATYPGMPPTFSALYRLLRTCELSGKLERGGNTILIGSGITVPEVLALYIEPPTRSMVHNLMVSGFTGWAIHDVAVQQLVQYKSGTATAVEPDSDCYELLDLLCEQYEMPENKIHLAQSSVGEVIRDGVLPAGADLLLVHRADPALFRDSRTVLSRFAHRPERRSAQMAMDKAIRRVLSLLVDKLKMGGNLVFTVGGGNNLDELRERKNLITLVSDARSALGVEPFTGLPQLFEDGSAEDVYFGGREFSIVGAVVAKRLLVYILY